MDDITFFKILYKEYHKEMKEYFKNDIKKSKYYYRFFDSKINITFFEKHKKKGNTNPLNANKFFFIFYAEKENNIISLVKVTRFLLSSFYKEERILFHRDFTFSEHNSNGIKLYQYQKFENDSVPIVTYIGEKYIYDPQGNIVETINNDLPFSFEQLADYFWVKHQIDIRRDFRFEPKHKWKRMNLCKYYEDNHPFWIINYYPYENRLSQTIVKVDGITGEEIFHREMLPEDMSYFTPTNIETTAP